MAHRMMGVELGCDGAGAESGMQGLLSTDLP